MGWDERSAMVRERSRSDVDLTQDESVVERDKELC